MKALSHFNELMDYVLSCNTQISCVIIRFLGVGIKDKIMSIGISSDQVIIRGE